MRVHRRHLRDLYIESGRAAVMVGEQVLILSEVATSILQAVPERGSVSLSEIVTRVVHAHGAPGSPLDTTEVIRQQVQELAAHNLLEVIDGPSSASAVTSSAEATLDALQGALRAALHPEESTHWELPPDVAGADFIMAMRRQRVGSQLATRLGRITLPDALRAQIQAHHANLQTANLETIRDLHQVLEVLAHADVRVLVFKGLALAAQVWKDPDARGYGDLDLLVAPVELVRAHEALTRAGWQPRNAYPTPGPSWGWRHFVRTEHEMSLARGRTEVDLHWHPLSAHTAFPRFEELWSRRAGVIIDGRPVMTFGLYDTLAHSASHSAADHWRYLRGIADVHQAMAQLETWTLVDRPFRGDQLLTVGLAARLFGVPDGAPPIVSSAAEMCEALTERVQRAQLTPERGSSEDWVPGLRTVQMMLPLWHSRVRAGEFARRLSTSAMPPWALARATSPHPYVGAPQALWQRGAEVGQRLKRYAKTHT